MGFILSHLYWFWFAVMVVMVVIEAMTVSLVTIWCAISAAIMIFLSLTGMLFKWQILIFLGLSLLLILTTRPVCIKKLHLDRYHTNSDSLIGQEMEVISKVTKLISGTVKASNGVVWNARSTSGDPIDPDTVCVVEKISGNTLIVKKIVDKEN